MNDICTAVLVMELIKRVGDQLHDPEPQYDAMLTPLDRNQLLDVNYYLSNCIQTTGEMNGVGTETSAMPQVRQQ